jgi:hypothetical protein
MLECKHMKCKDFHVYGEKQDTSLQATVQRR